MSLVANPLLPGCYPDPSICRVGDDYYLVTSTFEYFPGLPVFHSRDLVSWEQIGHVVDRAEQLDYQGVASSGGLYAPTLRHHDGTFWLVCTLVGQQHGSPGGNFIMTASDPAGPWSDPVWLGTGGIDPSIFFDDDGRVWLHGTRLAVEPQWHDQTEVWVRELDPATMALVGPEHVVWTGAVRGAVWAEGPHLYRIDDTYYLLAAEGGTAMDHAVCVARSESVTGPYEGSRKNPVLTHRHLGNGADVVGVGHADLVQAVDGSWWATVLGMRPYGGLHHNLGRETFLVPVEWEDGWPVFAPGLGRVPSQVEVPFALAPGRATPCGVVEPGDLRWTSLRGPASPFAVPRGTGWDIALRPSTLRDAVTPAFLGVRQQHQDLDVHVDLRVALADGEEAGIVVRQSEDDHVRFAVLGSGPARRVAVVHRRGGAETTLGEAVVPSPGRDSEEGGALELSVRARGQDYAFLLWPGGGQRGGELRDGEQHDGEQRGGEPVTVAVADGRTLDSVATGGFLGLWIGVYATSNGRPTTTTAHVDRLEYVPSS